jgi:hypothetical protein
MSRSAPTSEPPEVETLAVSRFRRLRICWPEDKEPKILI